jgi:OOP family OmpA-OmpF porin
VPDSIDQCPNTPKGDRVDAVGCTIKDEIKLERVHFATDSAELLPDSIETLNYGVATLKKYPEIVIEVRGHTDSTGSKQRNQVLSQRRAESVLQFLKDHGVTNSMSAKGYGEELPIASNATPQGRRQKPPGQLEDRRRTVSRATEISGLVVKPPPRVRSGFFCGCTPHIGGQKKRRARSPPSHHQEKLVA